VSQLADRIVEHGPVVWIQDRLDGEDAGMSAKRFHRAEDHGLTGNRAVLFRTPRAGAQPAPGCNEDGGSPFNFRHRALKQEEAKPSRTALITAQQRKQSDSRWLEGKVLFCCSALATLEELSKV
jgi:hypothetical protein